MHIKLEFKFLAFAAFLLLILTAFAIPRSIAASHTISTKATTNEKRSREASSLVEPVILTDRQGKYPLGLHLEILEDPSANLTITDVSSSAFAARFTPSKAQNPVYGFTESAYWVRLELDNETSRMTDWMITVNFANMHYVDLYTPLPDGTGFSINQSGTLRPISARDNIFPRIAFELIIPTHTQQTYYLRFKNGASMTLGMTLWTMKEFIRQSQVELLFYGLLFGALCALIAYHIFLLLTIREQTYLYFVLLLACLLVTLLVYDGYMAAYVLPNLNAMSLYVFPVTNAGLYLMIGLFSTAFLELKTQHPRLYWANMAVAVVWGGLILLTFLISFHNISQFQTTWSIVTLAVVLVSGFVSWRRGFHPAAIFMISWLSLVVSLLLLETVRKGLLPSSFIAENSFQPAFIVMAVGWSIALADRINQLKSENENAIRNLRNSEGRLSQILESMPLGVMLYEKDHKPKYANRRSVDILKNPSRGIKPDISAGRTLAMAIEYFSLRIAGSCESYPIENLPAYCALQGSPAYADDIEVDRGDGGVPLEMWASPIRDEMGIVESAVVVFQDITQRKQSEAELVEYRKHLEALVDKRTKELKLHVDWLSAINQINQTVARSADFTQIYSKIIEIINTLFAVQNSFIAELDNNGKQLKILAHSCQRDDHAGLIGSLTNLPNEYPDHSSLQQSSFVVMPRDQISRMDGHFGEHIRGSDLQSIVGIPLRLRERVLGLLGLEMSEVGRTIISEEAHLLNIFSTDIAQIMENARLVEQAKLSVAVEERNRIARELHDSVAQALYSISLYADAIRMAIQANKPQSITNNLEELIRSSRDAMADMRLLIFQLRPPILDEEGLVAALQSRFDSVESRAGFMIYFQAEGKFDLSADQETELYWIAQEILNNVIKHAQANEVKIELVGDEGCLRMTIEDNGVGFDPITSEESGGQGLRNIQERAEKIGATCTITSAPGQGSKISIEMDQ
jgi:signal transduction histidine kinase